MTGVDTPPRILIAGAGLGGLTAALALLQKGFSVQVFEQASELKEVGAGVQIAANGTRVLRQLGLEEELARIGTELEDKNMRLWSSGRGRSIVALGNSSVQKYGAPYYTVHRADLHDLLVRAVCRIDPGAFHLKSRSTGYEQTADGVTLLLEDGRRIAGDVLIGADGVHSSIRRTMFGPDNKPNFTGCMAWRGLVPDAASLPATVASNATTIWLGPNGHVVHYPVRRGEALNFFAVVKRDDWRIESWSERGTLQECQADFHGWHDDVQQIIRRIEVPYKWALITREPLPHWTDGRVSLLGDACHSMLPLLAQGANMALEDGLVLARCLDKHRHDLPAGLKSYEAARLPRTTRIVNSSGEQANKIVNAALADPNRAEDDLEREWEKKRANYDWAYNYDATAAEIA